VGAVVLLPPLRRGVAALVERLVVPRLAPGVVGDVFGPRRIRVRRDKADEPPVATAAPTTAADPIADGEVLEGEVISPPRRHVTG
jgi:UPF0716 protein FxsA